MDSFGEINKFYVTNLNWWHFFSKLKRSRCIDKLLSWVKSDGWWTLHGIALKVYRSDRFTRSSTEERWQNRQRKASSSNQTATAEATTKASCSVAAYLIRIYMCPNTKCIISVVTHLRNDESIHRRIGIYAHRLKLTMREIWNQVKNSWKNCDESNVYEKYVAKRVKSILHWSK